MGVWEFPVLHMRGGTSTGLVIWDRAAPRELALCEELLRHLMGLPLQGSSSDTKQITGLGRGYPTSNKVLFAEVTTNASGAPQVVSTLAQLASGKSEIDWSVNCGNTLRMVDPNVPYGAVWASRGKITRAEPISALYEQGRVHHVGAFPRLEDQMCAFTVDFDRREMGYSPDRVDALVWALTELMIEGDGGRRLLFF